MHMTPNLKGLYHLNQLTPEDFQKAWDYFQRAIDLDSDWADPHAGMAVTWMFTGYFGMVPENMSTPKINLYLDQALELDPNSAFAYYAHYLFCQRRHDEALIQATQGLELDPLILSLYAVVMLDVGDYPSAVEHFEKALACLEEQYEQGKLDVPYMASNYGGYEHFKSYPGYTEILKKYKLPYPKE